MECSGPAALHCCVSITNDRDPVNPRTLGVSVTQELQPFQNPEKKVKGGGHCLSPPAWAMVR